MGKFGCPRCGPHAHIDDGEGPTEAARCWKCGFPVALLPEAVRGMFTEAAEVGDAGDWPAVVVAYVKAADKLLRQQERHIAALQKERRALRREIRRAAPKEAGGMKVRVRHEHESGMQELEMAVVPRVGDRLWLPGTIEPDNGEAWRVHDVLLAPDAVPVVRVGRVAAGDTGRGFAVRVEWDDDDGETHGEDLLLKAVPREGENVLVGGPADEATQSLCVAAVTWRYDAPPYLWLESNMTPAAEEPGSVPVVVVVVWEGGDVEPVELVLPTCPRVREHVELRRAEDDGTMQTFEVLRVIQVEESRKPVVVLGTYDVTGKPIADDTTVSAEVVRSLRMVREALMDAGFADEGRTVLEMAQAVGNVREYVGDVLPHTSSMPADEAVLRLVRTYAAIGNTLLSSGVAGPDQRDFTAEIEQLAACAKGGRVVERLLAEAGLTTAEGERIDDVVIRLMVRAEGERFATKQIEEARHLLVAALQSRQLADVALLPLVRHMTASFEQMRGFVDTAVGELRRRRADAEHQADVLGEAFDVALEAGVDVFVPEDGARDQWRVQFREVLRERFAARFEGPTRVELASESERMRLLIERLRDEVVQGLKATGGTAYVKAHWVRERVEQLASDALVDGPFGAPGRPPFSAEAAPSLIAEYPNPSFEEVYGPRPLTEAGRAQVEATEQYLRALRNMEGEAVPVSCDAERRDQASDEEPPPFDDADLSAARAWLRTEGVQPYTLESPLLSYVMRRHVGQQATPDLASVIVQEVRQLEDRIFEYARERLAFADRRRM